MIKKKYSRWLARLVPTRKECYRLPTYAFEKSAMAWIENPQTGKVRIDFIFSFPDERVLASAPTAEEIIESIAKEPDVGEVSLRFFCNQWKVVAYNHWGVEIADFVGKKPASVALKLWKHLRPGAVL